MARIAIQQYRQGLVSFINVLTPETTQLNAEDGVVQSRQALAQDLVSVSKALGGGWSAADLKRLDVSSARTPAGYSQRAQHKPVPVNTDDR